MCLFCSACFLLTEFSWRASSLWSSKVAVHHSACSCEFTEETHLCLKIKIFAKGRLVHHFCWCKELLVTFTCSCAYFHSLFFLCMSWVHLTAVCACRTAWWNWVGATDVCLSRPIDWIFVALNWILFTLGLIFCVVKNFPRGFPVLAPYPPTVVASVLKKPGTGLRSLYLGV